MTHMKELKDSVEQMESLCADYEDLKLLIEMSTEEEEDTAEDIKEELEAFEAQFRCV